MHSLQVIGNYVGMVPAEKNMALIEAMEAWMHKFPGISAFVCNLEGGTVMQAPVEVAKRRFPLRSDGVLVHLLPVLDIELRALQDRFTPKVATLWSPGDPSP